MCAIIPAHAYSLDCAGCLRLLTSSAVGIRSQRQILYSEILHDPYVFIERAFTQWSPALEAFGALVAAILAFFAIYEGRRNQRVALLIEYLARVESFVTSLAMFSAEFHSLLVQSTSVPRNETVVASCEDSVMSAKKELIRSMVFVGLAVDSLKDKLLVANYAEAKRLLTEFPTGKTSNALQRMSETVNQLGVLSESMAERVHVFKGPSGHGWR